MLLALLLAAAPIQDRPLPDAGDDGTVTREADCRSEAAITVCGKRDQAGFRNRPVDGSRWAKPFRGEFRTPGGGRGAVRAEQRAVTGANVPALMVTVKVPLGRKPKPKK